ncbi:MAG TPA: tripartite tricarboxylate transporter substrate binding protein [Casimicrobiaceae bacterium]|nr:tripartite tricarboxylate transporter substrate binding protein [Casimicrobiaceae bacterium]
MKRITTVIVATFAMLLAIVPAHAQGTYPNRPVKVIVGVGPGSGADLLARIIAEEFQKMYGQPFIVENRVGASAQIAAAFVKGQVPDGYTLYLTSNTSHSVNPHIFKKLPYDPIADFAPIGGIAYFPFLVAVNPNLPIHTPRDLVSWAHANKGKATYAYGTPTVQIPAEALNKLMKLEALGVPYKSSPAAMTDVMSGEVHFFVTDLASSQAQIKAGKLRAIAVTMAKRSALAPELPTIEESLGIKGYDLAAWTGLFGPAGLPQDIVAKLSAGLLEILNRPDMKDRLLKMGAEATPSNTKDFTALVKQQLEVWGQKVRDAGIQPE